MERYKPYKGGATSSEEHPRRALVAVPPGRAVAEGRPPLPVRLAALQLPHGMGPDGLPLLAADAKTDDFKQVSLITYEEK